MSVLADLVVADRKDAARIAAAPAPLQAFEGAAVKGVDTVKFATLHELATGRSFDDLLPEYDPVVEVSDEGPWVFAIPNELVTRLTQLAPSARSALAQRWGATEEFDGWDERTVDETLTVICEQAQRAANSGRALFLWMSL